jgi:hypothetical protein
VFLDAPQRPLKSPKEYDLLPFFFAHTLLTARKPKWLRRVVNISDASTGNR